MGNEAPKKNYDPKMEKMKFEIACIKVKAHLEIQRDRRVGEVSAKEKQLYTMVTYPSRSKQDELYKASSIVTDIQFINGCNIVIRYCDILKDRSMYICESKGKPENIKELMGMIESIIWATKPLNLNCLVEFSNMMSFFFGTTQINVQESPLVDQELKHCFQNMLPSQQEINDYFNKFSQKYSISLELINQAGHNFHPPGAEIFSDFPPNNNNQGGQGGMNQPLNIPQDYMKVNNQPGNININLNFPQQVPGQFPQVQVQQPPYNQQYQQQQFQQPPPYQIGQPNAYSQQISPISSQHSSNQIANNPFEIKKNENVPIFPNSQAYQNNQYQQQQLPQNNNIDYSKLPLHNNFPNNNQYTPIQQPPQNLNNYGNNQIPTTNNQFSQPPNNNAKYPNLGTPQGNLNNNNNQNNQNMFNQLPPPGNYQQQNQAPSNNNNNFGNNNLGGQPEDLEAMFKRMKGE